MDRFLLLAPNIPITLAPGWTHIRIVKQARGSSASLIRRANYSPYRAEGQVRSAAFFEAESHTRMRGRRLKRPARPSPRL